MNMMNVNSPVEWLCNYIVLFFAFSLLGWCIEVVLKFFQYHRFVNRGFLIGPYCPIYGAGAAAITFAVTLCARGEQSYGDVFFISFFVCGILEYLVSYLMEQRFHARWWDYSQKPMNLHGRIWIGNLILFGIGGVFIIKLADPFLFHIFSLISERARIWIASIISVTMLSDYIVSHFVMKFVKASVENSEADSSERISKEIRLLLSDKSILYRRITDAYPDVIYRTEKIMRRMQEVKKEMERMKEEAVTHMEGMEDRLHTLMEPASEIKDDIIDKQDQLILLLESGEGNKEQIFMAHSEIDERKKQLDSKRIAFRGKRN